ncbi:MAG: TRAP transporter large permease [Minwuia sp.]|uniref:TRAP transporter large permease n=1 Tax=Minwuia sp. TaxID=2493630 RepID=UPI003A88D40E
MSPELITILIFVNLILFLGTGFPVAFSLIGVSLIWILILHGTRPLGMVPSTIFDTATTDIFIAAPLFIFMAIALYRVGIGNLIYEAIHHWTAGVPGGLAIGTVSAAALIAAMTGIGGTAVLVLGVLAIPEMLRRGYNVRLAIGGLPPGGSLGVLIPPTVIGVLLGGFAGIPVGHLFFGAAVPGILIAILFCVFIVIRCTISPGLAPRLAKEDRPSMREKLRATARIALPMLLIVLVLGSIWRGVATPSEAAGIGALGTLLIAIGMRRLDLKTLREMLADAGQVSVMVLTLVVGGALFSRLLQFSGSARMIADMMVGIDVGIYGTLLIFLGLAILLGMFIDGAAIIFIVTPIMMPVVKTMGIDPVWFGVMLMIAVAIGYVTPPFGMNLFYLKGIIEQIKDSPGCEVLDRVGVRDIWLACLPYVGVMVVALILVLLMPGLATWLPSHM